MRIAVVAVVAVVLCACEHEEVVPLPSAVVPTAPPKAQPPPALTQKTFVIAEPTITDAEPPEIASRPLPTTDAAIDSVRSPEFVQITIDSSETRAEIVAAITEATREGPVSPRVGEYYARVVGKQPSKPTCDWLSQVVPSWPPNARNVVLRSLAACQNRALAPLYEEASTSDEDLFLFYQSLDFPRPPSSQRLLSSGQRIVSSARNREEVTQLGRALGHVEVSVKDVNALLAKNKNAEVRAELVGVLQESNDKAVSALATKICKAAPKVTNCLMSRHFMPQSLGVYCGTTPSDPNPEGLCRLDDDVALEWCMRKRPLASVEKFVDAHPELKSKPGQIGLIARTIAANRDSKLARRLIDAGMTDRASAAPPHGRTIEDMFRVGDFPRVAPKPLELELALMAKRAGLTNVWFEQQKTANGALELAAFSGHKRYAVSATAGDALDQKAMAGLLNALLVSRASEKRFLLMRQHDRPEPITLVGDGSELQRLVDEQLIELL